MCSAHQKDVPANTFCGMVILSSHRGFAGMPSPHCTCPLGSVSKGKVMRERAFSTCRLDILSLGAGQHAGRAGFQMLLMQGNLQFPAVGIHYSFYVSFLGMSFRESFKKIFLCQA